MKPKIGQKIYALNNRRTVSWKANVVRLGNICFAIDGRHVYTYEDEGKKWFATLDELKHAYPNAKYDKRSQIYMLTNVEKRLVEST